MMGVVLMVLIVWHLILITMIVTGNVEGQDLAALFPVLEYDIALFPRLGELMSTSGKRFQPTVLQYNHHNYKWHRPYITPLPWNNPSPPLPWEVMLHY